MVELIKILAIIVNNHRHSIYEDRETILRDFKTHLIHLEDLKDIEMSTEDEVLHFSIFVENREFSMTSEDALTYYDSILVNELSSIQ